SAYRPAKRENHAAHQPPNSAARPAAALTMLPFIISGLVTGAVYGLAAVGLVLTYKTSGVFNFAHGALATVSAYLFYTLHVQHHLSWPLAAFICVFVTPLP